MPHPTSFTAPPTTAPGIAPQRSADDDDIVSTLARGPRVTPPPIATTSPCTSPSTSADPPMRDGIAGDQLAGIHRDIAADTHAVARALRRARRSRRLRLLERPLGAGAGTSRAVPSGRPLFGRVHVRKLQDHVGRFDAHLVLQLGPGDRHGRPPRWLHRDLDRSDPARAFRAERHAVTQREHIELLLDTVDAAPKRSAGSRGTPAVPPPVRRAGERRRRRGVTSDGAAVGA